MNPVRESSKRRQFVLYKVRYAALALIWLGALIATWIYWRDLGWPARVCLTAMLALATPAISDLFERRVETPSPADPIRQGTRGTTAPVREPGPNASFPRILMKMPIVFDDNGDVLLFRTKEGAESYLEAWTAERTDWRAWDGAGRRLAASKVPERLGGVLPRERLRLDLAETDTEHHEELRGCLVRILNRQTGSTRVAEGLTLEEVLEYASRVLATYP